MPSDLDRAMREASERRTATDTDSYAFSFYNLTPTRGRPRPLIMKMNISVDQCREIINIFNKRDDTKYDFDSHEFIKALKMSFPLVYYSSLLEYISEESRKEAYQKLHAQIGRLLLENRDQLKIEKLGKHHSSNYKNDSSENEKWQKL